MKYTKNSFLVGSLFFAFLTSANAADVPNGTKLAKNQVLNLGVMDNPPTLDPQRMEDTASARIGYDLYEGLVCEEEDGNVVPCIAERVSVSSDSLKYTFVIRKNAKFSDGSKITASDVVFSFRRLVDPKTASTYAYIAEPILNATAVNNGSKKLSDFGVKALTPTVVEITLEKPIAHFLKILAMVNFSIVKEANVTQFKDQFTQPSHLVSSGAFKLVYWRVGDKVTSEKNEHYWNAEKTMVTKVNYHPIVDANSELQMYRSGQLDFTWGIPSDQMAKLKETIPNEIKAKPFLSMYYWDLNNKNPEFKNNIKLRQALSMAVDRNVLTRSVTKRGESPAYDLVPLGTQDYTQQNYEWSNWSAEQRVAEAKKLFSEAGYSAEKPLKLKISYNTDINHKKVTLAVAAMWQNTFGRDGLQVELENQEWKVFLKTRQQGDYVVARDGWQADFNDASTFTDLLRSSNPQNNSKYTNNKIDDLLSKATIEKNPAERRKILETSMRTAMADYPVIPLYSYVTTHLVKPYVGGYTGKNPLDHMYTKYYYVIER